MKEFFIALLICCTVAFLAIFGMSIAIEIQAEEAWLYKWQTLFAGLLAVLAAMMTVHQMQRSDNVIRDQHREAMGVQLTPELRKMERAIFPHFATIHRLIADIEVLAEQSVVKQTFFENWESCCAKCEAIIWAVSSDGFEGARDQFSGVMTEQLQILRRDLPRLIKKLRLFDYMRVGFLYPKPDEVIIQTHLDQAWHDFGAELRQARGELALLDWELFDFEARYRRLHARYN